MTCHSKHQGAACNQLVDSVAKVAWVEVRFYIETYETFNFLFVQNFESNDPSNQQSLTNAAMHRMDRWQRWHGDGRWYGNGWHGRYATRTWSGDGWWNGGYGRYGSETQVIDIDVFLQCTNCNRTIMATWNFRKNLKRGRWCACVLFHSDFDDISISFRYCFCRF